MTEFVWASQSQKFAERDPFMTESVLFFVSSNFTLILLNLRYILISKIPV